MVEDAGLRELALALLPSLRGERGDVGIQHMVLSQRAVPSCRGRSCSSRGLGVGKRFSPPGAVRQQHSCPGMGGTHSPLGCPRAVGIWSGGMEGVGWGQTWASEGSLPTLVTPWLAGEGWDKEEDTRIWTPRVGEPHLASISLFGFRRK